jgi:hypothetical protein
VAASPAQTAPSDLANRCEGGTRFLQIVLLYQNESKPLPGLGEQHTRALAVFALLLSDNPAGATGCVAPPSSALRQEFKRERPRTGAACSRVRRPGS